VCSEKAFRLLRAGGQERENVGQPAAAPEAVDQLESPLKKIGMIGLKDQMLGRECQPALLQSSPV
jgi:hypothetical protein